MGKGGGGRQHIPSEKPDNLKSKQILSVIHLLSEGEVEGPVRGLRSLYLNDTPIMNDDGSLNFRGVNAQWTAGTQSQAPLSEFSELESELVVGTKVKKANPIVRTVTNPLVDRIRVTLGVTALRSVNDRGDTFGTTVQLEVALSGGEQKTVVIKGKTTSQYVKSVVFDSLPQVPFQITVRRLTPDSNSQKLNNDTLWSSYTEIIDSKLCYPNTSVLGLTLDSQQFSGVPRINVLGRGIRIRVPRNYTPSTRAYNGFWDGLFKTAWTNNPAWVALELATNERFGLGKRLGRDGMDKWALYKIAQYCDELVDDGFGGREPRMTCNVYLDKPNSAHSVLSNLFAIFRAMPIWNGMVLSASADLPNDPVYRYNNANVVDGKFVYQASAKKARHTAVHVKWQDPNNGWSEQTEYVSDDESIIRYGLNTKTIKPFGCTSRGQAVRAGKWLLITEKLERYTVTFSTGREGLRHLPGDVIEVADNERAGANIGGRVLSIEGNTITLDRPVETEGLSAWLGYIDGEGQAKRVAVASQPKPDTLVLVDVPEGLEDWLAWTLSTQSLKPTLWRCIDITETESGYNITALQHVPEKQAIIEQGIKFEESSPTKYGTTLPPVERLQVEAEQYDDLFQVRVTWDTPQAPEKLTFLLKLMRDNKIYLNTETNDTEHHFRALPMGNYNLFVRARNRGDQLGAESMASFSIAAPLTPSQIEFETTNYTVTARPLLNGFQTLGTNYDWYFGRNRTEVLMRTHYLGRNHILNHQGRKPDTTYWYGVEAVNAVGRSRLFAKSVKTKLQPGDILDLIGPEIPKLDWAKELKELVEYNEASVVLLEDRAALVVNNEGRVSGMTVTAESAASAVDFLADHVSFTDPNTLQRNLYWDNNLRTLVVKGQIQLLDGHSVSSLSDIKGQSGQDGNTIYTEFQFSPDRRNWHFPTRPGDRFMRSRTVTNGMASVWGGVSDLKGIRGRDASERYTWIRYADDAKGNGMSAVPYGKSYIGFAYNKTSNNPSRIPSNYLWSKFKGDDGLGIDGAGIYRIKTSTGVFPSDGLASSLFRSHVLRYPVRDDVLTVYAMEESIVTRASSKMFDGRRWVEPKLIVDGDLIAIGTIRGDHIVAGTEIRSPRIIGGEIYGVTGTFEGTVKVGKLIGAVGLTSRRTTFINGIIFSFRRGEHNRFKYYKVFNLRIPYADFKRKGVITVRLHDMSIDSTTNPHYRMVQSVKSWDCLRMSATSYMYTSRGILIDSNKLSTRLTSLSKHYLDQLSWNPTNRQALINEQELKWSIEIDAAFGSGSHYIGLAIACNPGRPNLNHTFNIRAGSASIDIALDKDNSEIVVD